MAGPRERSPPHPGGNGEAVNRTWFKSRTQAWRRSDEYKAAVKEAFKPYAFGSEFYRCAFCGKIFTPDRIAPCHIFHAGTQGMYHPLAMEPKNILPGCYKCHGRFDAKGTEGRRRQLEAILPGRWDELVELGKERNVSVCFPQKI